jgi:hypothetical protein
VNTSTIGTTQTCSFKLLLGVITLVQATAVATSTPVAAQVFEGEPIVVDNAGDEIGTEGLTLREALAQAEATPDDDTSRRASCGSATWCGLLIQEGSLSTVRSA